MMQSGLLTMSTQEIERITVIKKISEKQLKQRTGAKLLALTTRQVRRLVKAYRRGGSAAIISKHRGRKSNNQHSTAVKGKIKKWVELHYPDFGPTLAAEKLREYHQLVVNKETLRQWMIEWDLWKAKRQKKSRYTKAMNGERVWENLYKLMVHPMTGLKVAQKNVVCWFLLMMQPVKCFICVLNP